MILDKKIRVFIAVAEQLSFGKAARMLSLSQSVISHHIDSLEKELGSFLFQRQGRTISLTSDGEFLYKQIKKLSIDASHVEDSFSENSKKLARRISLAGDAVTCEYTFPLCIKKFLERKPDVIFSYYHESDDNVIDKLIEGEIDIGLVGHNFQHRKLETQQCFDDEIILVASQNYPKAKFTKDDFLTERFIWLTDDNGLEKAITKACSEYGVSVKDIDIYIEIANLSMLKNIVRTGVGCTFLPRIAVQEELDFGLLKEIDIPGLDIRRMTHILMRKDRTPRPLLVEFLNFIYEYFLKGKCGIEFNR